jgi:hypothetical protein
MALPPLELFSLEEKAALLPGGLFVCKRIGNSNLPDSDSIISNSCLRALLCMGFFAGASENVTHHFFRSSKCGSRIFKKRNHVAIQFAFNFAVPFNEARSPH